MSTQMIRLRVAELTEQLVVLEPVACDMQPGASGTGSFRFPLINPEFAKGWAVGDIIEWELWRRSHGGEVRQRNCSGSSSFHDGFVRDSVRVLSAAQALNNDMERSLWWYRDFEVPALGNRTPESLVREGQVQAVLDYIGTLS